VISGKKQGNTDRIPKLPRALSAFYNDLMQILTACVCKPLLLLAFSLVPVRVAVPKPNNPNRTIHRIGDGFGFAMVTYHL